MWYVFPLFDRPETPLGFCSILEEILKASPRCIFEFLLYIYLVMVRHSHAIRIILFSITRGEDERGKILHLKETKSYHLKIFVLPISIRLRDKEKSGGGEIS